MELISTPIILYSSTSGDYYATDTLASFVSLHAPSENLVVHSVWAHTSATGTQDTINGFSYGSIVISSLLFIGIVASITVTAYETFVKKH